VQASRLLSLEQKDRIRIKLANKITDEGFLLVKSQTERSQLGNKEEVIRKINILINQALIQPKKRKPTKPSKAAKEKRIESKKKKGEIKLSRKKINF
jgi:ribosome-associated protein